MLGEHLNTLRAEITYISLCSVSSLVAGNDMRLSGMPAFLAGSQAVSWLPFSGALITPLISHTYDAYLNAALRSCYAGPAPMRTGMWVAGSLAGSAGLLRTGRRKAPATTNCTSPALQVGMPRHAAYGTCQTHVLADTVSAQPHRVFANRV